MLFYAVFTLCVIGTETCETHLVPLPEANELTCLSRIQPEIVPYFREGMYVKKFGCTRE